jgi:hypothetical protein
MKKFGTPIGAAPGSANEKVGFDELGAPPLLPLPADFFGLELCLGLAGVVFFLPLPDPLWFELPGCLREDGGWALPGCVACGGVCVEDVEVDVEVVVVLGRDVEVGVEVEVVVEVIAGVEVVVGVDEDVNVVVDVDVEGDVDVDVEGVVDVDVNVDDDVNVDVLVVVGADVVVVGVQLSDTALPAIGSWIAESGVPGATLTSTVVVPPKGTATVTTQSSPRAAGSSAIACTASTVPTVASPTVSFRLLNTLAYLLPIRVRMEMTSRSRGDVQSKLPAGIWVCNAEPFLLRSGRRFAAPRAPEGRSSEPHPLHRLL